MASCEVCGTAGVVGRFLIEGTVFTACKNCSRFGKPVPIARPIFVRKPREEPELLIDPNCGKKIHLGREAMKLSQKELAEKLGEKETVIARVESGKMVPPIETVRKLEKFFGIQLITTPPVEKIIGKKEEKVDLTLGDVVKVR